MAASTERLVTIAEVKELLEKAEVQRDELTYEQKLALEHATKFALFSAKDAKALVKELTQQDKIDEPMAIRITDMGPRDDEDLKALFAKSRINLTEEDTRKIIETVAKYLPE